MSIRMFVNTELQMYNVLIGIVIVRYLFEQIYPHPFFSQQFSITFMPL